MARISIQRAKSALLKERRQWARKRKRPAQCDGCCCNPSTPGFDPLFIGAFIPPHGNLDCDLLTLGISGGEEEEVRGVPLTGPSGRKLLHALAWADEGYGDAPRLSVRRYNILNCRSIKVGLQGRIINRTPPTMKEARDCMSRWLLPELRTTKAKCIQILGTDVYKFIGMKDLFSDFGKAMGHRMPIPQTNIGPTGLGDEIVSYGKLYKMR